MKALNISKVILYFICAAFAVLLLFVYVFLPTYQKIADLTAQHNANLAQINFYNQKINNINSMNATIESKKKKLKESQTLPGINPLKIGENLNSQLEKTGVAVDSITVDNGTAVKGAKKSTDGKTLYMFPISLKLSGTADQFDKLLNGYETDSDAMYYINSVELTYSDTTNLYSGSIEITMYSCLDTKSYSAFQGTKTNG